ncbi:MAG: transcriptional regulator [Cellvibrionales bacterium]|nr:transcriptional regulator [Cellvibrionales bacterium]
MPLTHDFREIVKARAEREPEFRLGLFQEALEALLNDELDLSKTLLRDYVNATIGFDVLAQKMQKSPRSLIRMLSDRSNPRADNLLAVVAHLNRQEAQV